MKVFIHTLSYILLLLLQTTLNAQLPSNRSSSTKIADLLAQQPAAEKSKFLQAMKELEHFTEADFSALVGGLKPPPANNAAIEYAANSYSFYVTQKGLETRRTLFTNGLAHALSELKDKHQQGFVLQLLQQCAGNESIGVIVPFLSDEYLGDKAARALVGIGTNDAAAALLRALPAAPTVKTKLGIVSALGELRFKPAEDAIIDEQNKYTAPDFQQATLTALAKIGGEKSFDIFQKKVLQTNNPAVFVLMDPLIEYTKNLLANGQLQNGESLAGAIFKQAAIVKAPGSQLAALQILTQLNADKEKTNLLTLAIGEDPVLRQGALQLLEQYGNRQDVESLLAALPKLMPEVQESILKFLAQKGSLADAQIIKKLLAKKMTVNKPVIAALNAIDKLSIGSEYAFLIAQLKNADEEKANAIQQLLLGSKNAGAFNFINQILGKADVKTQVALLNILATRKNLSASASVLPLLDSKNPEVRKAAYTALPNVVNASDTDLLLETLGKANEQELASIQQAILVAVKSGNHREAHIQRMAANISRSAAPSAAKYFSIFSGLGSSEALNAVNNYTSSNQADLKSQALKALANWSSAEVLPLLLSHARKPQTDADFDAILSGCIKHIRAGQFTPEQKTLYLKDVFALARTNHQQNAVIQALPSAGTYQALIFAARFLNQPSLKNAATHTTMNIAFEHKAYYGKEVRTILNKVNENLSGSEGAYLKEAVTRHLAEMPENEGYVALFNGKDLTGWKGLVANPIKRKAMDAKTLELEQAKANEIMRQGWEVKNGELIFTGKGDNIATVKQYGDFEMLVDWKLEKEGKEGDAGIYLRGSPQVQIWDTSRRNAGAQVGSGGLYNNQKNRSTPLKVADNPLGEWNTFKIIMVDELVTVYLNGELVTDRVKLENYWDRNQSIFPTEQIELQAHGTRVYYRDIFIKEFPRKEIFSLTQQESSEGFEMLFDGTHLNKWTKNAGYSINEEGHLWVDPNARFGGNLYTLEEYGDFVYRFEFKLTPGANNGIGIRTPMEGDAAYLGMEVQVLDDGAEIYKDLHPYQYHGSVYGVISSKRGALKPVGEWNVEEISIQGNKIKVTLNGQVIVDGDLAAASKKGTLDGKEHPGLKRKSGHIAFCGHGSEVFFRNIRVKRLD